MPIRQVLLQFDHLEPNAQTVKLHYHLCCHLPLYVIHPFVIHQGVQDRALKSTPPRDHGVRIRCYTMLLSHMTSKACCEYITISSCIFFINKCIYLFSYCMFSFVCFHLRILLFSFIVVKHFSSSVNIIYTWLGDCSQYNYHCSI